MKTAVVMTALAPFVSGCSIWTEQPGVGDCAKPVDMSRSDIEMTKADCSSAEAVYKLVSIERGFSALCPRGDYVEETSSRNRKTKRKTRECYALNVREGDCLKQVGEYDTRADCATTPRKVTKVVNGESKRALCGPNDDTRTYDKPAMTVCITK